MEAVFRLSDHYASLGYDVLIEGLRLSSEYVQSASLANKQKLLVLTLTTPIDVCVRHIMQRRRAAKRSSPNIARILEVDDRTVEEACVRLRRHAHVTALSFDDALERARGQLGLTSGPPSMLDADASWELGRTPQGHAHTPIAGMTELQAAIALRQMRNYDGELYSRPGAIFAVISAAAHPFKVSGPCPCRQNSLSLSRPITAG